jgi:hypothetical protein
MIDNKILKFNIIAFAGEIGSGKNYIAEKVLGKLLNNYGFRVHSIAFADQLKYEIACRSNIVNMELINYDKLICDNALYNLGFMNILKNYSFTSILTYLKVLFRTPINFFASFNPFFKNYKYAKSNLTNNNIYDLVFKEKPFPIRMKLQNYAEHEKIDKNIWINSLHLRIINLFDKSYDKSKDVFIITDVRFEDEINFIKKIGGIVINIIPDTNILNNHLSIDETYESKEIHSHISENVLKNYKNYDLTIRNTFNSNINIDRILQIIF